MQRRTLAGRMNLILCIAVSLLAGCVTAPPGNVKEELVRHRWELPGEKDRHCVLTFTDHTLSFTADGFGEKVQLSGDCFVQEGSITVLSEEYGTVSFDYTLTGDQLELTFSGKRLTLVKQDEKESFVQN